MSLHRSVLLVVGLLALSGCGFEPIAAPTRPSAGNEDAAITLRSVSISSDKKRFSYHLRRNLDRYVVYDSTAPVRIVSETKISQQGLAIEQNDTVTRLNLTADTTYKILDALGDPIRNGTIRTITAVNATTELYATQVSQDEAVKRLAEETARRLVSVLRVENSKPGSKI